MNFHCAKCNRPVEDVTIFTRDIDKCSVLTATCHGQQDEVVYPVGYDPHRGVGAIMFFRDQGHDGEQKEKVA